VFDSPEEAQRACQKDRETFGDKFGDRYVRVYPTLESDLADMHLACQQQHMVQQVRVQWVAERARGQGCLSAVVVRQQPVQQRWERATQQRAEPGNSWQRAGAATACAARSLVKQNTRPGTNRQQQERRQAQRAASDGGTTCSSSSRSHAPPSASLRRPSSQGHSHMHLDSVVKMKSLPFDATQLDIIHFFEAYKLKPNGVQLVVRSDNKPTGEVRTRNAVQQGGSAAAAAGCGDAQPHLTRACCCLSTAGVCRL
jgi:epithelial splicing regulatory protein 1/2